MGFVLLFNTLTFDNFAYQNIEPIHVDRRLKIDYKTNDHKTAE